MVFMIWIDIVLIQDPLMGLLDIYPDTQSKAEAAKILLQQFLLDENRPLSNAIMVDNLLSIARILHDTLKWIIAISLLATWWTA